MILLPNGIAVLENDLASRWIEENNDLVHEPTVRVEICPRLKPGDVVVDAGAYLGSHTKAYLEAVGPTGSVIAFEPNPLAFECLAHNCPAADLRKVGLGRAIGLFDLKLDRPGNHGATFLRYAWVSQNNSCVPVVSLDDLQLPRLDFFKIDVEGMEVEVIQGAVETLRRCRPILYVEINRRTLARAGHSPWELVQIIELLNYRIQFMRPEHHLACEEINVFFFPM